MEFNIPISVRFSQVTTFHNKSVFTYKMHDTVLLSVDQRTYLGIILHHKMSWQHQVDHICHKANCLLDFLWRNLHTCPRNLRESSYIIIIIIIIIIFKDYRRPEGPLVWNDTLHIKYYIQLIKLFLISLALIINFPNR